MKIYFPLLIAAVLTVPVSQGAEPAAPVPMDHIDHPYQRIESLFTAVPSGTSLDQPQFEPKMGADVAEYLDLFHITHIDSLDSAIKLSLTSEYNGRTKAGTKIQIDRYVTFNYRQDANGTIICSNIVGIRVKPIWMPVWLHLIQVTIRNDTAGNTVFESQVEKLGVTFTKTAKVSPEGKVVPDR